MFTCFLQSKRNVNTPVSWTFRHRVCLSSLTQHLYSTKCALWSQICTTYIILCYAVCDQESSYTTCILLNYRPEQFLKTSEIHLDTPLGYLEIRVQKGEAKFLFRMKCSHLAEMFLWNNTCAILTKYCYIFRVGVNDLKQL